MPGFEYMPCLACSKDILDLPMKGNSKSTSGNSLSPSGVQKKDLGAALQTLLSLR